MLPVDCLFINVLSGLVTMLGRHPMLWSRSSSVCLLAAGIAALVIGGCRSPWSLGGESSGGDAERGSTGSADVAAPRPDVRLGSTSTSDEDQGMATVLDDLQQVGQIDPVAQQTLLEQLRQTEPALRPLVAQQFRASLAYHQQLVSPSTAAPPGSAVALASAPPDASQSEPIGSLVDPRQLRGDPVYEQALARATPAAIPVPGIDELGTPPLAPPDVPAAFVNDVPVSPVAGEPDSATRAVPAGIDPSTGMSQSVRATYELTGDEMRGVEPAVLRMPGVGPEHPHPSPLPGGEGERHLCPDPLPKGEGVDWRELVEQASADLSQRVPDSPQSTAEVHQHVSLRILQLLAGRTEEALRPIPDISPTEQEYWSAQLFAMATHLDHHTQPDDKRRAAAAAVHLDEALANLRELSSLSVRNLAFCKQVYDYGVYELCDSTCFAPGQQIALYAEVENYRSQSTEKGYSTTLGTSYKIVNDQDELVDGGQFPDVEDCCRSRRRDFHIQYGLSLPKDIAPGAYRLELVVKDRLSDKIGHASIPFKIGDMRGKRG